MMDKMLVDWLLTQPEWVALMLLPTIFVMAGFGLGWLVRDLQKGF